MQHPMRKVLQYSEDLIYAKWCRCCAERNLTSYSLDIISGAYSDASTIPTVAPSDSLVAER